MLPLKTMAGSKIAPYSAVAPETSSRSKIAPYNHYFTKKKEDINPRLLLRPNLGAGGTRIMDLNQYLERMNTNTNVI